MFRRLPKITPSEMVTGAVAAGHLGPAEAAITVSSNRHGEVIERHRHPPIRRHLDHRLIVATTNALDERMAGDDHSGRGPARARASVAATSSTGRDRIRSGCRRIAPCGPARPEAPRPARWVGRRLVRDDLHARHLGRADGLLEEPTVCVTSRRGRRTRR
jgi:hypothetical protein